MVIAPDLESVKHPIPPEEERSWADFLLNKVDCEQNKLGKPDVRVITIMKLGGVNSNCFMQLANSNFGNIHNYITGKLEPYMFPEASQLTTVLLEHRKGVNWPYCVQSMINAGVVAKAKPFDITYTKKNKNGELVMRTQKANGVYFLRNPSKFGMEDLKTYLEGCSVRARLGGNREELESRLLTVPLSVKEQNLKRKREREARIEHSKKVKSEALCATFTNPIDDRVYKPYREAKNKVDRARNRMLFLYFKEGSDMFALIKKKPIQEELYSRVYGEDGRDDCRRLVPYPASLWHSEVEHKLY